ncbi:hypothetical protein CYMTET_31229 [Cymbomonas tetramitiformis]|uniref:FMN-dependent NADH-azoreductase n=1 Tax=Cymbomonas tetramitiformis TaxID=36881 RepID=A0AAE0FH75_9CHLO|nr:hypothetical protein CYMTET_31229 [Cymbomonas tetramitiformis]
MGCSASVPLKVAGKTTRMSQLIISTRNSNLPPEPRAKSKVELEAEAARLERVAREKERAEAHAKQRAELEKATEEERAARKLEDERQAAERRANDEKLAKEKSALKRAEAEKKEKEEADARARAKKLLVVSASPMKQYSTTNNVRDAFIEAYQKAHPYDTITQLDLTDGVVLGKYNISHNNDPEKSKALAEQFLAHDKYLFATPMWNMATPSVLLQYLNHISQPNITISASGEGGLVSGRPAMVVVSSGAGWLGRELDHLSEYVCAVLGQLGFTDVRLEHVNGTADQAKLLDMVKVRSTEVSGKVDGFTFDANARLPQRQPHIDLPWRCPGQSLPVFANGPKLLVIDACPVGKDSPTSALLKTLLDRYLDTVPGAVVDTVDLRSFPLAPFSAHRVQAKFATWQKEEPPPEAVNEWRNVTTLIDRFLAADTYVFAVPMVNLGIPADLKLYLDYLIQPHRIFDPSKTSGGLVTGKPVYLITMSENVALGSPEDYLTSYMQAVLAYIGFEDIRCISASQVASNSLAITHGLEQIKFRVGQAYSDIAALTSINWQKLPRLPIPSLRDTVARYFASVKPLVPEAEFIRHKAWVEQYMAGPGAKLQSRLLEQERTAAEAGTYPHSYIEGVQEDTHNRLRCPAPVNLSPFFGIDPPASVEGQLPRAAAFIHSFVKWTRKAALLLLRRSLPCSQLRALSTATWPCM